MFEPAVLADTARLPSRSRLDHLARLEQFLRLGLGEVELRAVGVGLAVVLDGIGDHLTHVVTWYRAMCPG